MPPCYYGLTRPPLATDLVVCLENTNSYDMKQYLSQRAARLEFIHIARIVIHSDV
jgi:hypothetical protein